MNLYVRSVASTHMNGDWAEEPAGIASDHEPSVPVIANGSLPSTRAAAPDERPSGRRGLEVSTRHERVGARVAPRGEGR